MAALKKLKEATKPRIFVFSFCSAFLMSFSNVLVFLCSFFSSIFCYSFSFFLGVVSLHDLGTATVER